MMDTPSTHHVAMSWAQRLKCVFGIQIDTCARCGDKLTRDGRKASYSNFGNVIDIAAPGGDLALGPSEGVISTFNAGMTTPGAAAFGLKNGTSMATAHVSAVVGMMSAWNFYTYDQLEYMLELQTRAGTGPCEFPRCIRAINDYAAVLEARSPQGTPYYE